MVRRNCCFSGFHVAVARKEPARRRSEAQGRRDDSGEERFEDAKPAPGKEGFAGEHRNAGRSRLADVLGSDWGQQIACAHSYEVAKPQGREIVWQRGIWGSVMTLGRSCAGALIPIRPAGGEEANGSGEVASRAGTAQPSSRLNAENRRGVVEIRVPHRL